MRIASKLIVKKKEVHLRYLRRRLNWHITITLVVRYARSKSEPENQNKYLRRFHF